MLYTKTFLESALNTVRNILVDSREYDADTVEISASGDITALKDADKTFAGSDSTRYLVGHLSDMVDTQGKRREGY